MAVVAVLALGAFAVASASAAKPEFNPASNSGTSKGGKAKFTEKGGIAAVECTSSEGTSKIESAKGGQFSELFVGCSAPLSGKCTGLANTTAGDILVTGKFDLRYIENGVASKVGLLFLIEPTHFECEANVKLIQVKGCAVGKIEPTNTKTKVFKVVLKQSGGLEEFTEAENETNTGKEACILKSEKNGEAEKQAGQENTDEITEASEGEISA
jgi:hypothetical protein